MLQHQQGSSRARGKNPTAQTVEREQNIPKSFRAPAELVAAVTGASDASDANRSGDEAWKPWICQPSNQSFCIEMQH